MQLRQKALEKLQQQLQLHLQAPLPPGDPCPGCGRPSVRLLQCGWLTAVHGCDQTDCLHPLLGPVMPMARPYTDIHAQPPTAANQVPVADDAGSTAPRLTAASVVTLIGSISEPDPSLAAATAAAAASAASIVNPDEVFVRCFSPSVAVQSAAAAAAITAALFSRSSGGPMALLRGAYRKCLRTCRTAFRLSSSLAITGGNGMSVGFRGLMLDAQMSEAIDRELAEFDAFLSVELSRLMAEIGSSKGNCDPRDVLYNSLRCLFRHCARSRVSLKQMCTVCFEQNTIRSRCTVLRAGSPANDFDLGQPLKRVLLRPCASCGAPRQRVLFAWEAPGPPSALVVESPDGVALTAGQTRRHLRGRLSLGQGLGEFAPSAVIERRRKISRQSLASNGEADTVIYVVWLYSPECERWMAMSSDARFACYEDSSPVSSAAGGASDILAVVYERVAPASAGALEAGAIATGGLDGAESLEQSDEDSPPPPLPPQQQQLTAALHAAPLSINISSGRRPSAAAAPASCGSSTTSSLLHHRLRSVMRTRRLLGDCPGASSPAYSDSEGRGDLAGSSSGGGDFVMSRFLSCRVSAGRSGSSSSSESRRRSSRSRRLRSYAEDSSVAAVTAALGPVPTPLSPVDSGGGETSGASCAGFAGSAGCPADLEDSPVGEDFDILNLFL